jgi:hypothetical protein
MFEKSIKTKAPPVYLPKCYHFPGEADPTALAMINLDIQHYNDYAPSYNTIFVQTLSAVKST